MKRTVAKMAGRIAVLGAAAMLAVACATLGIGGGDPHHKVHEMMHGVDRAHMRSASQDLGLAAKGAREVGEHARALQQPDARLDDGAFLQFARDMEVASAALGDAIEARRWADIRPAFSAQTASCMACHSQYRGKK